MNIPEAVSESALSSRSWLRRYAHAGHGLPAVIERQIVLAHERPAPKGEWVGMRFDMEDGTTISVSIPYTLWQAFGNEYVLAMMSAGEIIQAAYGEAGKA
ncbi:hypothetical protein [Mesorhizobium sp. B4-1-4]|uniref:hypothetical protein n=1 Tax=Mesorhizobium sp. B4-1-4 TaxID=2589888 RepID=UPI00112A4F6C|nr:hypothetical protein [Mesorhizobium sp. B4-1-4]UCI33259.1 hypothetical protein FJW03_07470 [Mesorhizobium sp. B4-1-4]